MIDFIICLGGDGTILYTVQLFEEAVPPLLAFSMGTVGFLTSFGVIMIWQILTTFLDIKKYKESIDKVISGNVYITIRMRLACKIIRKNGKIEKQSHKVLNEVVIDRGPSPFLTSLECSASDSLITTVQADG